MAKIISIYVYCRLAVTRQLGLLQRDRPWTAITVKTRQATTSTLNIMILDTMQLKEEGYNIKFLKILLFPISFLNH